MEVTKDHRLLETWGNAEPYGLEGLEPGDDATELAPFLGDYAASEAVDLPFVTDAAGQAYHVHLIPGGRSRYVLYIDARDELEHQRRHQQTANEVKLLLERERRLIDELVDARTELIVRRKEAEEESRRRGEYIGTMSHEFRTPLTSVLAHAERLAQDAASPEDAQTGRAICRLTQHQLWLIDNLLLRARLEADGVALHRTVTDIRKLVDDLCLVFAPLAADKALSFGARVGHDVPELVLLDDLHFRQVLVNLLGNAVKYTEEGSVELDIQHDGAQLSASVTDTGPGMHRDEQAALFDPFRRGREAPRVTGAGLGLSITRRLVEAMEGELDLDSGVDQGTRVTVRMAAPAAENASDALDPGEARLIVLGEDDPDISALLEVRLGEAGYRVHGVTDGEAVVDSALSLQPSLVIVDTNMPKLDGPAAARKLRENGFDAPILALSGASSRQDIDYALSSGCTEFLRKPPHLETLKRLIHRLILTGQTAPTAPPPPPATTQTNVTEP
jgi:signal transduction histidine kinase/ActR/RegA family two-component response regulator